MNKLIQVIHFPETNSVEATWAIQTIEPAVGVEGSDGYQPEKIDNQITRCHSYADVQMDMFRSDVAEFGGDISEHETMIALVEANIKPSVPAPVDDKLSSVIIPSVVSMRQARLALLQAGLLSGVTDAINAITDEIVKQSAQIEFEFATVVDRNSAFTQQLVSALGLSSNDVDKLFLVAGGL